MTPASREPVSWHAVTRDLNRYRVVSAMAILRQLTAPDSLCYTSLFWLGGRWRSRMSSSNRVLSVLFLSRNLQIRFLLVVIAFAACIPCRAGAGDSHSVTPDEAVAVGRAVRAFMQTVSHSVTQDGPLVWIKYFDASPAFFMAVNGQVAFPNAAAAQEGTRKFAQTIRQI